MVIARLFGILLLLVLTSSCSFLYDWTCAPVVDYFYPDAQTFYLTTRKSTNDRSPIYFLIKSIDFPHFLLDDYPAIVTAMENPSEDPDIIATFILLPGTTTTFQFKVPEGKGLAFYALYTNPKQDWKYLMNTKQNYRTVKVLLGEQEIESVDIE